MLSVGLGSFDLSDVPCHDLARHLDIHDERFGIASDTASVVALDTSCTSKI